MAKPPARSIIVLTADAELAAMLLEEPFSEPTLLKRLLQILD